MSVISKPVLVLNKLFVPVNVTTVEEALKQMYVNAVTALNIAGEHEFHPVKWEDWIQLPIREGDRVIRTPKLTIRAPSVVVACDYDQVHRSKLKLTHKNVKAVHNSICAYTGEYAPDGNVDHIVPKAKGGTDSWDNVVWCKRSINSKKGSRTNREAGLKDPKPIIPAYSVIPFKVRQYYRQNAIPEWQGFLKRYLAK